MKNYTTSYDIDLVYLWVDGNDTEWLEKKYKFLGKDIDLNTEATSKARNANNDELKYSLRSVEKHAHWIRKVFIVTDEQTPDWLDLKNPKVEIVDIRQLIPDKALPCYNSVVIEHFLYKIPTLSEHFLYGNDDMFFNANVNPDFFFSPEGLPIVRLQPATGGKWANIIKRAFRIHTNIYRKTIDHSARLIEKRFGTYYSGTPHYNFDSYLKSDYKKVVEEVFRSEIGETVTNHIRTENDIQRIIYLYYALAVKRGLVRYVGRRESCRIRLQKPDFMRFIVKYKPVLFCLNDTHRATDQDRKRIKPFLNELFPNKSLFEN
ncbi:MAG: stealth family protein [Paludibacter sp.]